MQRRDVRGHEFHYSIWENRRVDLQPAFILHHPNGSDKPTQLDGSSIGNIWATYVHTHFLTVPSMASRFVAACRAVDAVQSIEGSDSKLL